MAASPATGSRASPPAPGSKSLWRSALTARRSPPVAVRSDEMHASHRIALAALTTLIASGCGTAGSGTTSAPVVSQTSATVTKTAAKAPPAKRHRRTAAEEQKAMAGDWIATGNVLRAKNQYNLIHGDQIGE